MSNPISDLRDFLSESPSVVFPQDVLEYLPAIEADNAKLHQQLADVTESMGRVEGRCAKLRELVRDMHKALFSLNLDHCQACPREDACVFMHKSFDCDECAFERDMRELGIEVDE